MSLIERSFVLAVNSPAEVGENITNNFVMARSGIILKAFINAKKPPVDGSLIVDIKKNGKSIWGINKYNRLRLNSRVSLASQSKFDTIEFAEGDMFSIDIFQIGSTFAGQDITVQILTHYF